MCNFLACYYNPESDRLMLLCLLGHLCIISPLRNKAGCKAQLIVLDADILEDYDTHASDSKKSPPCSNPSEIAFNVGDCSGNKSCGLKSFKRTKPGQMPSGSKK